MEAWKEELYHHGILGQRWGKRNGPPYPLSVNDHSVSEKKAGWKKSISSGKDMLWRKKRKQTSTVLKKSNHRRELELKFRQQGMSRYQAQKAAEGRIQLEKKILITAGVVTVAALATYGAYKYKNYVTDKVLSEDVTLQRMALSSDKSNYLNERNFYASYKKGDKKLYGLYGGSLSKGKNGAVKDVDLLKIKRANGLTVASEKTSRDAFEELWNNNPEFRSSVVEGLKSGKINADKNHPLNRKQWNAYKTAMSEKALPRKDIRGKAYDAFNINIVNDHSKNTERAMDMYVNSLKKKGIDAIGDINDMKYSTYKANHPLIVFKDDSAVYDIAKRTMGSSELASRTRKGAFKWVSNNVTKRVAPSAATVAIPGVGVVTAAEYAFVKNYKREHPNTRLTNSQIVKQIREKK